MKHSLTLLLPVSEVLAGLAYLSIPAGLWLYARRSGRSWSVPYSVVAVLAGVTALAHFVSAWGMYHGAQGLEAFVKSAALITLVMLLFVLWLPLRKSHWSGLSHAATASDDHSRYLFEASPIPMYVRDFATGGFLAVNEGMVAIYGYTKAEFARMAITDLQPTDEAPELLEFIRERGSERRVRLRSRHRRKNGSLMEVELASHPISFSGKAARLVVINDVSARVNAERAVREAEQRYYTLFEESPDGVMLIDPQRAAVVETNQSLREMLGYGPSDMAGLRLNDMEAQEGADGMEAHLARVSRERGDAFETRLRRRGGEVLDVMVRMRFVVIGGKEMLLTVLRDVTEQKRATLALRDSESRLRTIANNIPALIGYVDAEQRYRFANRTYEEWYGRPPEADSGRTIREVVGEDAYRAVRAQVDAALSGQTATVERRIATAAGELYTRITYVPHRNAAGEVAGFYIFGYDITERRLAEEALARERTLLQQVVDSLPDHVYVKDRARRYLLINATGLAARGVSEAAAVVGKTAFDYFEPDIAADYDSEDGRIMEQGISILNRETEKVMPGGEKQWHLTTKLPLRDPRGEIVGMLGVNRDITEMRKRDDLVHRLNSELEQRVTERTAQLEAANQELESFAYSVSHDLRAPLRSIEGFSRALLEDYRDRLDDAGRDHLERVRGASQRMASLIDDLLSLSRFSRGELHRVEVDLAAMARRIVSDLRKEQPGRDVELTVPRRIGARADASLMYAVLDNLLRNAWKFTERRTHARIEVLISLQGDLPCYCVRDNGVGFDMAYAGKLFGAFQRLHSASDFPGTGIGLATVQRIVHRHGGRVWAQAVPGEGATFCFTLGDGARSGAGPETGLPGALPLSEDDVTGRAAPGDR